jgi:hypothetical protein
MLLNRREDPADLEKGLLLILFELEESRSSVVFVRLSIPRTRSTMTSVPGAAASIALTPSFVSFSRTTSSEGFLGRALTSLVSS